MRVINTLLLSILYSFLCPGTVTGQTTSRVHIVTAERNHLPGFMNFHFTVNGKSYKLRAGQCLELTLSTDSINLVVEDKRLVKKQTDDLHLPTTDDMYIWVRVTWTGNYRNPRYGAEVVCRKCFDEIKSKCKKTFEEVTD